MMSSEPLLVIPVFIPHEGCGSGLYPLISFRTASRLGLVQGL